MICVAISEKDIGKASAIVCNVPMAEIRLDLTAFSETRIREIFTLPKKLIATFRPGDANEEERIHGLSVAIESGAAYVDIEIESTANYINRLVPLAHKHNCDVIISYHNFDLTPPHHELIDIIKKGFSMGANVVKVATMVNTNRDNATLLALYKEPGRIVSLGMGHLGKITRVVAPFLGAEFTFASTDDGLVTAPGQIPVSVMSEVIGNMEKALGHINVEKQITNEHLR